MGRVEDTVLSAIRADAGHPERAAAGHARSMDARRARRLDAARRNGGHRDADLRDADLRDAERHDTDLRDTDLRDAERRDAGNRDAGNRDAGLPDLERPDGGWHGMDLVRCTRLPSGVLYPALVRLERRGLIASEWTPSGRRRYLLTADGVTALDARPPTRPTGFAPVPRPPAPAPRPAARPPALAPRPAARPPALALRPAARPPAPAPRRAPAAAAGAAGRLPAVARWLPALVIAVLESAAALSRPAGDRLADLGVYVGGVDGLRHGASLYDYLSANHAPFTYPPFAGLVLWPLTVGATVPRQVGWTCLTVVTVVALSILLARTSAPPRRNLGPAIAAVLFLSAPVSSDLRFGQVSVGLAALVALDVLALGRHRLHGALIGVAAAVKLTPLIFIPMLWLAGRRTAAAVAASTFVACGVLAWGVLPGDSRRFWGTEMWRVSRLGHITSAGNQSFDGALMRFGVDGPVRALLVLAVAGPVAAVALRRAARSGRHGDWLSATTVVGAAGIVVSPVSWTHHQLWSVLAVMLPVAGPIWARWLWRAGVLAVMILPVTALGTPVFGNARMLAAVAIACLVPLRHPPDPPPPYAARHPRQVTRPVGVS